jgi:aryl-alcohol dehydrogenase-like predicted oxidoreductase
MDNSLVTGVGHASSRLVLGTAQFGLDYGISNTTGKTPPEEAIRMLDFARVNCIDTLDTAISYGDSERLLGEIGVKDFKIITKIPGYAANYGSVEAWVTEQVEASLCRLRVDRIYGLLFHRPEDTLGPYGSDLIKSLHKLKNDGLVKYIGLSVYSPQELDNLTFDAVSDMINIPYNVIDRRFESSGWLSRIAGQGRKIYVRSVFLQGLLLISRRELPNKFRRWERKWESWELMLRELGTTAKEVCLSLPLRNAEITKVIVGAENLEQLEQLVEISRAPLIKESFDFMVEDEEDLVNPSKWF